MTALAEWLERHTAHAPVVLRDRVREQVCAAENHEVALAQAARGVLEQVVAQPGDRSVALDLLAADALITLALLAQAESAPERLGDFAASLLRSERPAGSLLDPVPPDGSSLRSERPDL